MNLRVSLEPSDEGGFTVAVAALPENLPVCPYRNFVTHGSITSPCKSFYVFVIR